MKSSIINHQSSLSPALDRVFIRDLALRCTVGVDELERRERQGILVQITLYTDLRKAGRTDALEDTIDYRALKKRILHLAEQTRFYLIEALAQSIADECCGMSASRRWRWRSRNRGPCGSPGPWESALSEAEVGRKLGHAGSRHERCHTDSERH